MEKILTEQTTPSESITTTVSENVSGDSVGEVSLGKFKDINALLSAYNSLQSEFTKRCQKVKELEDRVKALDKDNSPKVEPESTVKDDTVKGITPEEKEEILKGYLKDVLSLKSKAIVMGDVGTGVKSPTTKPKTVEQAGLLAREFLETKK
jgi:hypothetical protein